MDVAQYNRKAWDHQVEQGNRWTIPVSEAVISEARAGRWHVVLTPSKTCSQFLVPEVGRFESTRSCLGRRTTGPYHGCRGRPRDSP